MNARDQVPRIRMSFNMPVGMRLWLKRKAAELDTTMSDLLVDILQNHIKAEETKSNNERS